MLNWLPPFFYKQNFLLFIQPRWQPRRYIRYLTSATLATPLCLASCGELKTYMYRRQRKLLATMDVVTGTRTRCRECMSFRAALTGKHDTLARRAHQMLNAALMSLFHWSMAAAHRIYATWLETNGNRPRFVHSHCPRSCAVNSHSFPSLSLIPIIPIPTAFSLGHSHSQTLTAKQ